MAEYFGALISIATLAALGELVAYKQGGDRAHRFAVSVVLLYTALVPLVSFASSLGETDFFELIDMGEAPTLEGGAYVELSEEAFKLGIERLIADRWSLEESSVVVSCVGFDFSSMRAEKISVVLLKGGALVDRRAVERYVESVGLGECEVSYGFE